MMPGQGGGFCSYSKREGWRGRFSLLQPSNQQISQAASEIHNYPVWKGVWGPGLVAEWDSQESRERNSGFETVVILFQCRGELLVCFLFGWWGGGRGFICVIAFTLTQGWGYIGSGILPL